MFVLNALEETELDHCDSPVSAVPLLPHLGVAGETPHLYLIGKDMLRGREGNIAAISLGPSFSNSLGIQGKCVWWRGDRAGARDRRVCFHRATVSWGVGNPLNK